MVVRQQETFTMPRSLLGVVLQSTGGRAGSMYGQALDAY